MSFPLPSATLCDVGLAADPLDRLFHIIDEHVATGRYPGAQIAIARNGQLAVVKTFGDRTIDPARAPAHDDTLWLLYSNTKVLTACAVWLLVERGALRFTDAVAAHVPEFKKHGKGEITVIQLLTHQGGFPNADVPAAAWEDHGLLARTVCDFTLEGVPGSQVHYHGRSAHWTAAVLIEALTQTDYRAFIRDNIAEPLGLAGELFVGLPEAEGKRAVDMHEPGPDGRGQVRRAEENTVEFRRAGSPAGGGYATARAMAAFYQMMASGGTLNGVRLLSPRLVEYVTRNYTGERVDGYMGMPMHRGLGPHVRGTTDTIRGLGSLAHPRTFGHGGVGSSYCWADPESGVSFAYLTNSLIAELGLVSCISARAGQLAPPPAAGLFALYSGLNGVTLSVILIAYTGESVTSTFVVTAGMFGALALFGSTTKRSLAGVGQFMMMGLIGLILASVVGLFWHNDALQFLISVVGVIVFTGLTAYDAQRLRQMAFQLPDGQLAGYAIVGALSLYLDFINLFLMLLRLTGRRD